MGLTVEHVDKSFGQLHVIKDLSMEVKEGSIFGFLGANGAGKTTTMCMILDIIRPDSGRITWNGKDMREIPRHNLGYLPEERGLYPKVEAGTVAVPGTLEWLNKGCCTGTPGRVAGTL